MNHLKYFRESEVFRRLFKNAGKLIGGDVLASVLNLFSMAIAARVLGPGNFGILAIVQSYVVIVDQLFNFQSWQALIKYGSDVLAKKDKESFKSLIKVGFGLDISTAIIGTIAGVTGAIVIGPYLDWEEGVANLAIIYSLIILFNINGTPTAILRLYDRFDLFAYQKVVIALFKIVLVVIGFLSGAGLLQFLWIWIATDLFGYVLLIIFGLLELKKQRLINFMNSNVQSIGTTYKGIWSYVWTTNLHGSVRMASMQFDILIVGILLGNVAVGYLKVAKQFAQIFSKLSQPIYKSIYPELTRLWANNELKQFRELVIGSGIAAGTIGLIAWLFFLITGKLIIEYTVGISFIEGFDVMIIYMFAIIISMMTLPLTPSILAMGLPKLSFYAVLFSTTIYFPVLYVLILKAGLIGVGYAYIIFYCIWLSTMVLIIKNKFKDGRILKNS